MGVLTDDITRLCSEIGAMRRARGALKKAIARGTKERRSAVSAMQAGFSNAHAEMARQARTSRKVFVSNLKHTVAGQRRELRNDLAGAHEAWCGWSSTRDKREEAGRRAKLETRAEQKKHEQPVPPDPPGAKSEGKREGAKPTKPMHFLRHKA